jgi:hypothetical protein
MYLFNFGSPFLSRSNINDMDMMSISLNCFSCPVANPARELYISVLSSTMSFKIFADKVRRQSSFRQSVSRQIVLLVVLSIISIASGAVLAVEPSCTTDATGSTSCNVGINTVPTFASLDGGYQWLTDEVTTTSISGSLITETIPVFTATETNLYANYEEALAFHPYYIFR